MVQLDLKRSVWSHKSLAELHEKVCLSKKLDSKTAAFIGQTMEQRNTHRSDAKNGLLRAEKMVDEVRLVLNKAIEKTIEAKRQEEHEVFMAKEKAVAMKYFDRSG